ncbi:DUF5719 family protein [Demetria terragena]|uniref:DUF5719 family protein n=1 Tax=Demetria terragena TaxID=63959 RepID=UPI00036FCB35|nr:DUF5719 family protein [Demetria terragena]
MTSGMGRFVARAARAVAFAGAGVGLVWGAGQVDGGLDLAQASDTPPARSDVATVGRSELVCPGPDRPGVPGVPDPQQTATIITGSAPPSLLESEPKGEGSATATTLPGAQRVPGVIATRGGTRPVRIDGPAGIDLSAKGALAPGLSALQVGVEQAASVKGLTMLPCAAPVSTSYLLAGGAAAGQAERIVLTNPAPNPAQVTLSVLGTSGRQQVVVPSRSRKVVVLGSIDDTAKAPVVRVSAPRGPVAAAMVESRFAGAVARGTEAVGPAQAPARTQVIPSLVKSEKGDAGVRVGVPGGRDAVVRLSVIGPEGADVPDDVVRTVRAGSSADIGIPSLPPGNYAIRVSSDEPVVTAGRSRQVASQSSPTDVLWSPATAPMTGLGGLPVPKTPGGKATLVLAAPGNQDVSAKVSTVTTSGDVKSVTVALVAGQTRTMAVDSAASVWVEPQAKPVSAALVVNGMDGKQPLLSGAPLPVAPMATGSTAAPVRPADQAGATD